MDVCNTLSHITILLLSHTDDLLQVPLFVYNLNIAHN